MVMLIGARKDGGELDENIDVHRCLIINAPARPLTWPQYASPVVPGAAAGDQIALGSVSLGRHEQVVSAAQLSAGNIGRRLLSSCGNHLHLRLSEVVPLISNSSTAAIMREYPSQDYLQASPAGDAPPITCSPMVRNKIESGSGYSMGPLMVNSRATIQEETCPRCHKATDLPLAAGSDCTHENAWLQQLFLSMRPVVKTWRLSGSLAHRSPFAAVGARGALRRSSCAGQISLSRYYSRRGYGGRDNLHVNEVLVHGSMVFTAHGDHKIRVWKRNICSATISSKSSSKHQLLQTLPTARDCVCNCFCQDNYIQIRRHHRRLWIQHVDTISALAVGSAVDKQNMSGEYYVDPHDDDDDDDDDDENINVDKQHLLLYSASWDKTFKVWSLSQFRCMESVVAHHDAVNAIVVGGRKCCGQQLVYTGSSDGTVKVWAREAQYYTTCSTNTRYNAGVLQLRRKKKKRTCKHELVATLPDHKCAVNALATSRDGGTVFSAAADGTIRVWRIGFNSAAKADASEGRVQLQQVEVRLCGILEGHKGAVLCLCVTAGDQLLLSGSADKTIRAWSTVMFNSLSSGVTLAKVQIAYTKPTAHVDVEDGVELQSTSSGTINHGSCRCLAIMQGHKAPVKSVLAWPSFHNEDASAAPAGGYTVYAGALDMAIRIWWLQLEGASLQCQ